MPYTEDTMNIATFNLRNLFDEGPRQDYDKIIQITKEFNDGVVESLSNKIRAFAPDILVTQEIGSHALFSQIATRQVGSYQTFVAEGDQRGIANGALFRVPCEATSISDVTGIPVIHEGEIDTLGKTLSPYRKLVYLKTDYANKPLHIIGLHIKTTSGIPLRSKEGAKRDITTQQEAGEAIARALLYRLAQALRLRELVDAQFKADPHAQVIVLGDFNAVDNSELLRIITGDKRFSDTQLINLSERIEKERRYSFAGYREKRQLDHILISKNLVNCVEEFQLLNEGLEDQTLFPEQIYFESDHAPLILTLK